MTATPTQVLLSSLLDGTYSAGAKDFVIPLWGLSRVDGTSTSALANPQEYCRIQLLANNGSRYEQSVSQFLSFSEFFRQEVMSDLDMDGSSTHAMQNTLHLFVKRLVPVDVVIDQNGISDDSSNSCAVYECWGIQAPKSQPMVSKTYGHRIPTTTCRLAGQALPSGKEEGEHILLRPASSFGLWEDSMQSLTNDTSEILHLRTDFFVNALALAPVHSSTAPTSLTVTQHNQLLDALKAYSQQYKGLREQHTDQDSSAFLSAKEALLQSAAKGLRMKIPAQAIWRFDFYEGVPTAGQEKDVSGSFTHGKPILALDSEFLGSILVYLRKLEKLKNKDAINVPPVKWNDLDTTQKKRVREIVSLLGLMPLYEYLASASALNAKNQPSNLQKSEQDSNDDNNRTHRTNDEKDTLSLIERTMLISAIKSGQLEGPNNKVDNVTSANKPNPSNDEWVREFRSKVANMSRIDAVLEERNRMLGVQQQRPSTEAPASPPIVPPHPSVDDDDLELPAGGACYRCGISGHCADECKY